MDRRGDRYSRDHDQDRDRDRDDRRNVSSYSNSRTSGRDYYDYDDERRTERRRDSEASYGRDTSYTRDTSYSRDARTTRSKSPKRESVKATTSNQIVQQEVIKNEQAEEQIDYDEDAQLAAFLGISSFGSTKGKKVEGNDRNEAVDTAKKRREYRQYLFVKGSYDIPLTREQLEAKEREQKH